MDWGETKQIKAPDVSGWARQTAAHVLGCRVSPCSGSSKPDATADVSLGWLSNFMENTKHTLVRPQGDRQPSGSGT